MFADSIVNRNSTLDALRIRRRAKRQRCLSSCVRVRDLVVEMRLRACTARFYVLERRVNTCGDPAFDLSLMRFLQDSSNVAFLAALLHDLL